MNQFKTLRERPGYYNDGEGTINIYCETDESKNVKISQQNCVLNERQIVKLYEYLQQNPHIKYTKVYKKDAHYEGPDEDFSVYFHDENYKKVATVSLADLPDAENPELMQALEGEEERLKQEKSEREAEWKKRILLKEATHQEKHLIPEDNPFTQYKEKIQKKAAKIINDEGYGTKVDFLGGNNEYRIGASSILVEHNEPNKPTARILIDDGAMFPPDWIGYDSAIPDMRPYFDSPYGKAEKPIDAMFITHCHEDHIGALVFLAAAKYQLPKIYTSQFTRDFIYTQMRKNSVPTEFVPEIEVIKQGEVVDVGDNMKIAPFNISHSTAGALGFHIETTLNGKSNAGLLFTGDYHLDEVPFGEGFDAEAFKKFISRKYVSHIFMDSTSATTDLTDDAQNRQIPDFEQAVENTYREISKHPEKQIFSPVIARSVQNLAIDIKCAALSGRTVLIGSQGLRDATKTLIALVKNKEKTVQKMVAQINKNTELEQKDKEIMIASVKQNAESISELMKLPNGEKINIEEVIYGANDLDNSDLQKYLTKYPPEKRYMIISGAFAEDKAGRKSCLVLMSEQNKVVVGKDGKVKGKGDTGHPLFTVDTNTLFMLRQRPIESINGPKHRATVAKLQSLGATVILNGDTIDTKYQRTGHATKEETLLFHRLTTENCKNHEALADGTQEIINVAVHGDQEQLPALLEIVQQHQGQPFLCLNTDILQITPNKTTKQQGLPFEQQKWICVQAKSITGAGYNNLFMFDLCDHNLMLQEHLFTVMNVTGKKREGVDSDYMMRKAIEKAQELENEGMSASNIEIRRRQQSKKRKDHGTIERMTYKEWLEREAQKPKGKFSRHQKKMNRRRGGRE